MLHYTNILTELSKRKKRLNILTAMQTNVTKVLLSFFSTGLCDEKDIFNLGELYDEERLCFHQE